MGAAGAAGVARREDLGASRDGGAGCDVGSVAVAVGPAGSLVVFDGDPDSARLAAGWVLAAAMVPPVVRPILNRHDSPASDGVDRGSGGEHPVPGRIGVMRFVDRCCGEQVSRAGDRVAVGERRDPAARSA